MGGGRGLPGGGSLAALLHEHRDFVPKNRKPQLTVDQILQWADVFFAEHGKWPSQDGGDIAGTNENWSVINSALVAGRRGLPGGQTLPTLLREHRNHVPKNDKPQLSVDQIVDGQPNISRHTGGGQRLRAALFQELTSPGRQSPLRCVPDFVDCPVECRFETSRMGSRDVRAIDGCSLNTPRPPATFMPAGRGGCTALYWIRVSRPGQIPRKMAVAWKFLQSFARHSTISSFVGFLRGKPLVFCPSEVAFISRVSPVQSGRCYLRSCA